MYRGDLIALNDDPGLLAWFRRAWDEAGSTEALARTVLSNEALWERDLSETPGLIERIVEALEAMEAGALLDLLERVE